MHMNLLGKWLENKIYHKEISDYIANILKVKTIAIYGAGKLGELVYDDLLEHQLEIKYFIDRNADSLYYGIDDMTIYNLKEVRSADPVDLIIVTPYQSFENIKKDLERILIFLPKIISIEEIVASTE